MVEEARLAQNVSGLAPATEGWFVVNVRDAAWHTDEVFGAACIFEGPEARFADLGINLRVLRPGQPAALYHAESNQEDFLVLSGECLLLVEGEERMLRAWDFVHCPPNTKYVFIGAGDAPCVILMTSTRKQDRTIVYPDSELACGHGAGVETETNSPAEAYAAFSTLELGQPEDWDALPWV